MNCSPSSSCARVFPRVSRAAASHLLALSSSPVLPLRIGKHEVTKNPSSTRVTWLTPAEPPTRYSPAQPTIKKYTSSSHRTFLPCLTHSNPFSFPTIAAHPASLRNVKPNPPYPRPRGSGQCEPKPKNLRPTRRPGNANDQTRALFNRARR